MAALRKHGAAPFSTAVLHGGPGAAGSAAVLAERLSEHCGVLEPYQRADSLEGQVFELCGQLREHAQLPCILVGHSWGAWLGYIVAARFPELVRQLFLVSSGPFEAHFAAGLLAARKSRLNLRECRRLDHLLCLLERPEASASRPEALAELAELLQRSDSFDPLPDLRRVHVQPQQEIYQRVWPEAAALRASGGLLELGRLIRCPVTALHGDIDPHPAAGVVEPLSKVIEQFEFVLLKKCGHEPWIERSAHEQFFLELISRMDFTPSCTEHT